MKIKNTLLGGIIVFLLFSATESYAYEKFEVSIAVNHRGRYVEPIGRVIKMYDPQMPFMVIIKNVSPVEQALYDMVYGGDTEAEMENNITFEVYDEKGKKNIVSKNVRFTRSNLNTYRYIYPGQSKRIEVSLNKDEWNNAFKMYEKGAKKVKVRAILKNGPYKIKSDFYNVEIE